MVEENRRGRKGWGYVIHTTNLILRHFSRPSPAAFISRLLKLRTVPETSSKPGSDAAVRPRNDDRDSAQRDINAIAPSLSVSGLRVIRYVFWFVMLSRSTKIPD